MIEKCKSCNRYDKEQDRMKNKLFCMFNCEEYKQEMAQRAIAYNRAVSGEDFDKEPIYEHGKKVFGSGAAYQDADKENN